MRSQSDERDDELLIALDDDPALTPYLEAFDRLMQEPPMSAYADAVAWWDRLWSAVLEARVNG
jgi:hypothetical protein